jgi:tRNA(Ile)-lysidine synthase TilS/MesJ
MLDYNDKVAVAVSGGKDSLALLFVMKKIFEKHDHSDLIAITIDEGIEGYRNESLQIVKEFCSELKIESKILSYKNLFGIDMDKAILTR